MVTFSHLHPNFNPQKIVHFQNFKGKKKYPSILLRFFFFFIPDYSESRDMRMFGFVVSSSLTVIFILSKCEALAREKKQGKSVAFRFLGTNVSIAKYAVYKAQKFIPHANLCPPSIRKFGVHMFSQTLWKKKNLHGNGGIRLMPTTPMSVPILLHSNDMAYVTFLI